MGEHEPQKVKKHICAALLAHVDAGKTTLAESLLYLTGSLRKLGRVDHGDAFLDTHSLERERGITIFSKQAEISLGETRATLLDTPGHVDFSAEMERTLQVLDYAILVISAADGVQGHVQTLWRLLKRYRIPVFLFINKMDQEGTDRAKLLAELKARLDDRCVDFGQDQESEEFMESLAMCEEDLLESYLETGTVEHEDLVRLIAKRKAFPCYFGSALKVTGIKEFLNGLETYMREPDYPEEFGAKIYKISRDEQGVRLTHMKITGGSLKVKMPLAGGREETEKWEEKADQIRIYSGAGYRTVEEAPAGTVCAVTGLSKTHSGEGLGIEGESEMPVLEPVLTYRIGLPSECDVHHMLKNLRQLEEEEPELHIVWEEQTNEIHVQMMGEVQIDILKRMILERFGVKVDFGAGSIVYKETVRGVSEGVGHFEPLRHYAEVHLILEPGEPGSGLQFFTDCSEDMLDRNWQRLILTHLEEKKHRGVLTGSEITDMRITLAAGRAHQKHTEGGDFRQATYRAVRQGLKKADSILLEPVYEFRLEVPSDKVGRALADIQRMHGAFSGPEMEGELSVLTGTAPVSAMRDYQMEVSAYASGRGRLSCSLKGYQPCHNAEEVIESVGYEPEKDLDNPTGSVFCAHGAGFVVPWDQVEDYMHLESCLKAEKEQESREEVAVGKSVRPSAAIPYGWGDETELKEIFDRTYGSVKQDRSSWTRSKSQMQTERIQGKPKKREPVEEYMLVDGYNIIFAWEELRELAQVNMEGARNALLDLLCNYQGYKKNTLIVVFDAYKVKGNPGEVLKYNNIHVVYTKEAETADQYIEKTVHEIARTYQVTVATSDAAEQAIIWGQGAFRMSALGLREELLAVSREIREQYLEKGESSRNYLLNYAPKEMEGWVEEMRLGKQKADPDRNSGAKEER